MKQNRPQRLLLFLCAMLCPLAVHAASPTVAVSPGYTNIGVNATLQYTATVTGVDQHSSQMGDQTA